MSELPRTLGRYRVIRPLGRGSTGTVCLGYDPKLDRPVAIKIALASGDVPRPDLSETWQSCRAMFERELTAASRLTHPGIVRIYDAGVDGLAAYLVMELVPGGHTLKPYTRRDSLMPVEQMLAVGAAIAEALDAAHSHGVVHRDVKPANILMTPDGEPKLSDFSVCGLFDRGLEATSPEIMLGSPRYMAPEQLQVDVTDHRCDIFSLGIVLYQMATGVHPFDAGRFSRLVFRIVHEDPEPASRLRRSLPESLDRVLATMLAKDPLSRYQRAAEVARDLRRIALGVRAGVL